MIAFIDTSGRVAASETLRGSDRWDFIMVDSCNTQQSIHNVSMMNAIVIYVVIDTNMVSNSYSENILSCRSD